MNISHTGALDWSFYARVRIVPFVPPTVERQDRMALWPCYKKLAAPLAVTEERLFIEMSSTHKMVSPEAVHLEKIF